MPAPYDPADEGAFPDLVVPRTPAYGTTDADDPAYVRDDAPFTADEQAAWDDLYRKKARSMLAVERAISDILEAFWRMGQLENTYFVFTSDNGHRHGEHGSQGKHTPYEEDINVPLFVRGPSGAVTPGAVLPQFALNIDLNPTICEWAGIAPAPYVDGRSLAPLLRGETQPWRSSFLIEHWREGGVPTYKGVRSVDDRVYVEYATGEQELYGLAADPYQLNNLMDDGANPKRLREQLAALRGCAGDSCRATEGR